MKDKIIERFLTALGYAMGVAFMGGAIWLCWELIMLLFSIVVHLVS